MRHTLRYLLPAVTGLAVLSICAPAGAQGGEQFKARLAPVPVEASTLATITGSGAVTAVLAGNKLSIAGTFERLTSPATVAHLHNGPKGVRGPVAFTLTVSKATSGTISASLELKPDQIQDLRQGKFYVQIHSEKAPDGIVWGWLLK